MMITRKLSFFFAVLCVPLAHGAVTSATTIGDGATSLDGDIAPSLVTAASAALQGVSSSVAPSLDFSLGGLSDGQAVGEAGGATFAQSQATLTFFENLSTPVDLTFKLTGAYNITSISSLAGWGDTFFGSQQFTVSLETGNSGIYTPLPGIFGQTPYTPPAPSGFPEVPDPNFSTRTTVSDDAGGYVGSNVTGIRLTYQDPYPTFGQFNGIVLREISVTGSAVPEAESWVLGLLSAGALVRRRR